MNNVTLMGRLTKDPETKETNDGLVITRFTVAVDDSAKNDGTRKTNFISCVSFRKTAEFVAKYFTKGKPISLVGKIQTGSYEKQDGTRVYTTDVVADRVEFVPTTKAEQKTTVPAGYETFDDDDFPF